MIAAALPAGGAIALVLSSSARTPIENLGISNGFRPGLVGVAKDMADELGPRGVRVVSLLPGRFLTDRTRDAYGDPADPTKPAPAPPKTSRYAESATRPSSAARPPSCSRQQRPM